MENVAKYGKMQALLRHSCRLLFRIREAPAKTYHVRHSYTPSCKRPGREAKYSDRKQQLCGTLKVLLALPQQSCYAAWF